ncbi:class I SAM-dependent methyltransferase [Saccharopolyspora shandongensis]|uniref:class I SAM-dependent methyltransferase n=1 Tax=Saccharopolyspora shandongensis TaxID=418495 RepID=UPI001C431714|nr:class I SAM-dependent methyltransferase [Saccharopolyspora shandongensis]
MNPIVLAHADLDFNAPMSDARAEELIAALAPLDSAEIVDLGCGRAELLLRLLEAEPSATGIDTTDEELSRGRHNAEARGVAERVRLAQGDACSWDGTADVAISIGSSHAWGGTRQALEAIRPRLRRGGRLLLGEAFRDTASMRNDSTWTCRSPNWSSSPKDADSACCGWPPPAPTSGTASNPAGAAPWRSGC